MSRSNIKILNLSSGQFLDLNGSVAKQGLKFELGWDSVNVIGRMDPIYNYKNTKKTRNLEITITNPSSNAKLYYYSNEGDTPMSFKQMKEYMTPSGKNKLLSENLSFLYNSNGKFLEKFFHGSYLLDNGQYFLQSAPMFYISFSSGNLLYSSFCIIKNFDFISDGSSYTTGKALEKFTLSLQIEEIRESIDRTSSIIRVK